MRRDPALVLVIVALVLLPMWAVALASGNGASLPEVSPGAVQPNGRIVPMPSDVHPNTAGVITWIALLILLGTLAANASWLRPRARDKVKGREEHDVDAFVPGYVQDEHRRVVRVDPPAATSWGLALEAVLALVVVSAAFLLNVEVMGPARTQVIGLLSAIVLVALAEVLVVYARTFLPHIVVAEDRAFPRLAYHGRSGRGSS